MAYVLRSLTFICAVAASAAGALPTGHGLRTGIRGLDDVGLSEPEAWTSERPRSQLLHRQKRRIKEGTGHVISTYKKVPGMALDVALEIVTNITARDCAVRCVHTHCAAWSHNEKEQKCRLGCVRFPGLEYDCAYFAVPVIAPDWDFYETSPNSFGVALGIFLFSGASSHAIDIKDSQIYRPENPLAPENVIKPQETHVPDSVLDPSTPKPGQSSTVSPPITPTVSPSGSTPPPVVTQPPPPVTEAPLVVTPPRPLTKPYLGFPLECGVRPSFGLSDNVRLLSPEQEQNRIIGGAVVAEGTYPWQAQISVAGPGGFNHSCGAVIISGDLMLTAAHCNIKFFRHYQITVAQHNLYTFDDPSQASFGVQNIFSQTGYQPELQRGQRNDIAVLRIKFQRNSPFTSLQWDDYVQPICLPSPNTRLHVGQKCQISGWGVLTSGSKTAVPVLRGAVVSILDPRLCYKAYGSRFDHNLMVCAGREEGGVDTCQGDSGGPLSCRDETGLWFVAGIVSFGWGCGEPGHPGVYTRVTSYLEFIHRTSAFITGNF